MNQLIKNKKADMGWGVVVLIIIGIMLLVVLIIIAAKSKSGFTGIFSGLTDMFG